MKFIIRADASRWIGSGHIMRCLVLADGLKAAGHQVIFVCRPQAGDLIDLITDRGHQVIKLPALATLITPVNSADYSAWLQVPWQQDAAEVLTCVTQADWVVVDHYGLNAAWEQHIKQGLDCQLLAIDDLVRTHATELILDQTLGRTQNEYLDSQIMQDNQPVVLTGVTYALLSPQFGNIRKEGLQRSPMSHPPRVLLSFGGIDEPNVTLKALRALSDFDCLFTVLLSPRAPHYHAVKAWCDVHKHIAHYDFVQDIATLMSEHDLAIGAPGTTSWERACLGLPNIVIPIAENQEAICKALLEHKATIVVEQSNIESELHQALCKLLLNYRAFVNANIVLCDGEGVGRVMNAIFSNVKLDGFTLRAATNDDAELVYQWQSEPVTRRYAINPNIPSWTEHKCWFENRINSHEDYFLFIVNAENNEKNGVVRLDKIYVENYLISIFVAPDKHGKGIGLIGLKLVDLCFPSMRIQATVLPENIPSQRLFTKAGYQQVAQNKFIREPL